MSNLEFVKRNVTLHEYEMHKLIYELDIVNVPRPISYDFGTSTLVMERIDNLDISNMYGDDINLVPKDIVSCVRMIIRTLLLNDIEYHSNYSLAPRISRIFRRIVRNSWTEMCADIVRVRPAAEPAVFRTHFRTRTQTLSPHISGLKSPLRSVVTKRFFNY